MTSNDAALSVTDWPKSHGVWIPSPLVGGDVYEYSHRVVAAGLGVLTLILSVLIWMKEERLGTLVRRNCGGRVAQAILGGGLCRLLHSWLRRCACFGTNYVRRHPEHSRVASKWWVQTSLNSGSITLIHSWLS